MASVSFMQRPDWEIVKKRLASVRHFPLWFPRRQVVESLTAIKPHLPFSPSAYL